MNHLVQRRARRHRVQQKNDARQQTRQCRPAVPKKMVRLEMQIICNIAGDVPSASRIIKNWTRYLGQKVPEMTPGLHADVTF
jgi:hypothetical protein